MPAGFADDSLIASFFWIDLCIKNLFFHALRDGKCLAVWSANAAAANECESAFGTNTIDRNKVHIVLQRP